MVLWFAVHTSGDSTNRSRLKALTGRRRLNQTRFKMRQFLTAGRCLFIASGICIWGCQGQLSAPYQVFDASVLSTSDAGTADASVEMLPPWETPSLETSVARVKNLLTGLTPTADEISSVAQDPAALERLVGTWIQTPEAEAKLLAFFVTAFQQGQVGIDNYMDQFGYFGGIQNVTGSDLEPVVIQQLSEMFPRTALHFVKTHQPFTRVANTREFMVTTPLAVLFSYSDTQHVADDANAELNNGLNRFGSKYPKFSFQVQATPTLLANRMDPKHPDYMKWGNPIPLTPKPNGCDVLPFVWGDFPDSYDSPTGTGAYLQAFLFGRIVHPKGPCVLNIAAEAVWGPSPRQTQFEPSDWTGWRLVQFRTPKPGEDTTLFYDLPKLRSTPELVLSTPRVGFFSTPAFFANWQTNTSNLARVAMNQTLIVALGTSFDGSKTIVPVNEQHVDAAHASPSTTCYGCHQTLDPMTQFFRQAYSLHYHDQIDEKLKATKGVFAFDGVSAEGNSIYDLGDMLARHPRFAVAWAQKLCFYANAAPCQEDDPVFISAVTAFRDSNHDFTVLLKKLFSSPLVTLQARTKTFTTTSFTPPVARRELLCDSLSSRLKLVDVCGLHATAPTSVQVALSRLALSLPGSSYSRGSEVPSLPVDSSLFYRLGVEQVCAKTAALVVDAPNSPFQSANPSTAIDELLRIFLQLSPDSSRYVEARRVLEEHFAQDPSIPAGLRLQSTFTLACLAPPHVGSGL